ncbi:hypothetical protein R1sor_011117 [Riccia sorocarpa]|uniref:Uncharacterized protein n=1 Tax=Riccia sorocarpa TaxID=122646 RepID=A0ABD3I170_9MARC
MAATVVGSIQCPFKVTCLNLGADLSVLGNGKNAQEFSSSRWLAPVRVLHTQKRPQNRQQLQYSKSIRAGIGKDEPADDKDGESSSEDVDAESFRLQMERMMSSHDERFEGKDLATLIRRKYGRSYDVQLVKKEFLGRQLLAMNVMWKYREQRSFPLTEEEYILHLDYVAQNLRGWGAVSYVRDSLEKTRERPRIGKAVSIFIEVDEKGNRQNEWIQR